MIWKLTRHWKVARSLRCESDRCEKEAGSSWGNCGTSTSSSDVVSSASQGVCELLCTSEHEAVEHLVLRNVPFASYRGYCLCMPSHSTHGHRKSPHRSSWIKTLQLKEQHESDFLKSSASGELPTDLLLAPGTYQTLYLQQLFFSLLCLRHGFIVLLTIAFNCYLQSPPWEENNVCTMMWQNDILTHHRRRWLKGTSSGWMLTEGVELSDTSLLKTAPQPSCHDKAHQDM